jgi:epsin
MSKGLVRSGYGAASSRQYTDFLSKNLIKGYSNVQIKVREATSNDAWGPAGAEMRDIAEITHDPYAFVVH